MSTVEWVTAAPAPPLAPFVERYIGYRMAGFPAGLHRGLPSRHMTLVVSIGDPVDVVAQTNPAEPPRRYRAVLGGLQASAALIAHPGHQEGVQIELSPLGSRALAGVPAGALWDASLELAEVVGRTGDELWERLQEAATWEDRFAACDDVLGRRAAGGRTASDLAHAWTALVASGGGLSVGELAFATGWSRQHLRRRFAAEFGLSPKLAARVIRFGRAARLLQSTPAPSIARVAVACGYYDQSHLNRDVADLAACTPAELLREDVPFFQDAAAADPAYSPA